MPEYADATVVKLLVYLGHTTGIEAFIDHLLDYLHVISRPRGRMRDSSLSESMRQVAGRVPSPRHTGCVRHVFVA